MSVSPSVFTTPRPPLTSDQRALRAGGSAASLPAPPSEPPPPDLAASPSDEPYISDHVPLQLPVKAPRSIQDVSRLSPSRTATHENQPVDPISIPPNPAEILVPSYHVPFIGPHPTSPSFATTEVPPEAFYPTNTMDVDWGSGDYMETLSYLNSDGDDYYLVTRVPSDTYDPEDYTETYDTSFPSRLGVSLTSLHHLHISPSPSLTTAYSTAPSSSQSTAPYTPEPTPPIPSDPVDASDADWSDAFTVHPTHILLPDMNSLEYYTTQLSKDNPGFDGEAEQGGDVTVESVNATDITPTRSTVSGEQTPTEDEPSSELSGSEPYDETATTEKSSVLVNVSEPLLHPSIVPASFSDPSHQVVSSTRWSAATAAGPGTASLTTAPLADDITASFTDVQWFTESFPQSTLHMTPDSTATTAFPPESPANVTPPQHALTTTAPHFSTTSLSSDPTSDGTSAPPVMVGDEGVTGDEDDTPATMTLIPSSSDANTVSAASTTATPTATSHQTTTGAGTTTVDIISSTGGGKQTTTQTPRRYLCNVDRPEYLVKIGKRSHTSLCA